jgi:hypothetical protein
METSRVFRNVIAIGVAALTVSGCASGLLGGGSKSGPAPEQQIAVNNELALPPDLSLAAPGTRAPPPRAAAPVADDNLYAEPGTVPSTVAAVPRGTQGDIYEQYGISKLKPDGTKKSDWELRQELRAAVLKKKQQTNPNYGTIWNVGELFKED